MGVALFRLGVLFSCGDPPPTRSGVRVPDHGAHMAKLSLINPLRSARVFEAAHEKEHLARTRTSSNPDLP